MALGPRQMMARPLPAGIRAASCSVAATLELVGGRRTLLILREAFYGVRRFEDFARNTGAARNLLADRLRMLVDAGIMTTEQYREAGDRARYEYRLTAKGRDLFPVIIALMQWGDRYLADPDGPPVEMTHRMCDAPVTVTVRCDDGHGPLSAAMVKAEPAP